MKIDKVYNVSLYIQDNSKVIPFFGYCLNRYKEETKQEPNLTIENGQAIQEFEDGTVFILIQVSQSMSITTLNLEDLHSLEKKLNIYISDYENIK